MRQIVFIVLVSFLFFGCSSKKVVIDKEKKDLLPKNDFTSKNINKETPKYLKDKEINIGIVSLPKKVIKEFDLDLENLLFQSLNKNFKNDEHYKKYYVPFGGKYILDIEVVSYSLDSSLLDNIYQINFDLNAVIKNRKNQIVFKRNISTKSSDLKYLYTKEQILSDKNIQKKSIEISLDYVIKDMIESMKKI